MAYTFARNMKPQTFITLLVAIACLVIGWVGRGRHTQTTELDRRNQAIQYLLTDRAGTIFKKLGEFGVQPDKVRFLHAGSGVQVQVEAEDERAMEIAKALQPMVPDFGSTMVSFLVEGSQEGGIMVYSDRIWDTRPIVAGMLKQLNQGPEKPEANKP